MTFDIWNQVSASVRNCLYSESMLDSPLAWNVKRDDFSGALMTLQTNFKCLTFDIADFLSQEFLFFLKTRGLY